MKCQICQSAIPIKSGRVPKYCSGKCRQKAYRKRASRVVKAPFANDERVWVRAAGKRPVMVDGSSASSTDPATWASFAEVQKSNAGDGFGVVLDGSGLGCFDFDNCFDGGVLNPAVRDFIAGIAYPIVYVERSVSGNGLHVFVEAEKQRGFRRDGVEFYSWGRFIKTTLREFSL